MVRRARRGYTVKVRDDPWFKDPGPGYTAIPDEVLSPARRDFGDMLLTPQRARDLGLDVKPDFRTHTIPAV